MWSMDLDVERGSDPPQAQGQLAPMRGKSLLCMLCLLFGTRSLASCFAFLVAFA